MLNLVLVAVALVCAAILLSPRVRNNNRWRATVTPLASIIGSGFLVIVPLLGHAVGGYAPVAMVGVVVLAYVVGSVIRYNIIHVEPRLKDSAMTGVRRLDYASDIALGVAYFISVTFYLRLLAAFALRGIGSDSEFVAQIITSVILGFIGVAGWFRGLSFLERLEEYSVSIKLAIIAALLIGWAVHDASQIHEFDIAALLPAQLDSWHVIRLLAGVLIVVQGFETSRYLGDEYAPQIRVATMRRAQILAGLIYVLFVALAVPTFGMLGNQVNETVIMELSQVVAPVLPTMLIVAAVMSQLSAAVADTVGTGGLFAETLGKRFKLPGKVGYILVAVVGIVLVWTANIFEIIALASRAFAFYYALQCLEAAVVAGRDSTPKRLGVIGYGGLALILFVAVVIAIPAG